MSGETINQGANTMASDLTRRKFIEVAGMAAAAGAVVEGAQAAEPGAGIKILGISTSFRKGKATATALQMCLDAAKAASPEKIAVELIDLADLRIDGRVAAGLPLPAGQTDDFLSLMPKLEDPQVRGIIVATPVYFGTMSSLCKAFLERLMACRKNNFSLSNKVAAVVAVGGGRDGGQELTIRSVQTALMSQNMIIVGEGQPSCHTGAAVWNTGDQFAADENNQKTVAAVGRRVAEVAMKLAAC
jgi:multimeric flavodoxin WrbA